MLGSRKDNRSKIVYFFDFKPFQLNSFFVLIFDPTGQGCK